MEGGTACVEWPGGLGRKESKDVSASRRTFHLSGRAMTPIHPPGLLLVTPTVSILIPLHITTLLLPRAPDRREPAGGSKMWTSCGMGVSLRRLCVPSAGRGALGASISPNAAVVTATYQG